MAKTETYNKKTPKIVRANRNIESRLPKDMMCNICGANAIKVIIPGLVVFVFLVIPLLTHSHF